MAGICELSVEFQLLRIAQGVEKQLKADDQLLLYIPHSPALENVVVSVPQPRTRKFRTKLRYNPTTLASPVIGIFWYSRDDADDGKEGHALQGSCYVPMDAADTGPIHCKLQVANSGEAIDVATLEVRISSSTRNAPPIPKAPEDVFPVTGELDTHLEKCAAWLSKHKSKPQAYENLDMWRAPSFDLPCAGRATKQVPMWFFPWSISHPAPSVQQDDRAFASRGVHHLLRIAMARMQHHRYTDEQLCDTKVLNEDGLIELLCEMATILPLSLPYRHDHTGSHDIEQWTWAGMNPRFSEAAIDCEDASELILRTLHAIRHAQNPSRLLQRVRSEALDHYEFVLCVGTLKVAGQIQWHAFVMGFDAAWLAAKRDESIWRRFSDRDEAKFPDIPAPRVPPVLLEGTDYLTSNYRYGCSPNNMVKYSRRPWRDQCAQTKIPSSMLMATHQYHYLVMAFTPQWVESHGVGTLFFAGPEEKADPSRDERSDSSSSSDDSSTDDNSEDDSNDKKDHAEATTHVRPAQWGYDADETSALGKFTLGVSLAPLLAHNPRNKHNTEEEHGGIPDDTWPSRVLVIVPHVMDSVRATAEANALQCLLPASASMPPLAVNNEYAKAMPASEADLDSCYCYWSRAGPKGKICIKTEESAIRAAQEHKMVLTRYKHHIAPDLAMTEYVFVPPK